MARRAARRSRAAVVASSRAKAFASFTDQFSSSLRSGWKTVRSGWGYENNKVASILPAAYPLISAPIKNSDVTITLKNPGIGTGAALWVTDSGNWWAIVTEQEQSVGTGDCSSSNPVNNCGAGGNCGTVDNRYAYYYDFGNQCVNTYSYNNGNNCVGGNVCQAGPVCVATNVCVGGNACQGGNVCVGDYVYTTHQYYDNCKTGGNCVATGGNCKGWGNCLVYGSYYVSCCKNGYNTYNACAYLNACVGGYIWWSTYNYDSCAYTYYDNCKTFGWDNCSYTTVDNCAWTYQSNCAYSNYENCVTGSPGTSAIGNCSCCSRTEQDIRLVSGGYIDYCGFTNACIATGGECTGHYDTYPRYIKIYKYVSNILTEVASQTVDAVTSFTPIRALKVTVSNSVKGGSSATVTTKAYSDTNMTAQIGSDFIHQATGLKITTNYGIIAKPSSYNQNISVEQVSIG